MARYLRLLFRGILCRPRLFFAYCQARGESLIYWQIEELDAVSSADQHKGRHSNHGIHSIGTLVRRWNGSARQPRCLRDRVLSFIIICVVLIKFSFHRFHLESLADVASRQLNYSLANKVKPLGGWDAEHEIAGVWRPTGREYHMVPLSYGIYT